MDEDWCNITRINILTDHLKAVINFHKSLGKQCSLTKDIILEVYLNNYY